MSLTQGSLKEMATACAQKVLDARDGVGFFDQPYKHIVVDDFLEPGLAQECLRNFPATDQPGWEYANDADIEVKFRTTWKSEFDIPEGLVDAVRILNCSLMLNALAKRLSIAKLVADPYFSGGGLNVTKRGGLLDVHVDGNYHDATGLNRRLNVLLYLTPDWREDWGGEFGVYDKTGTTCLKRVAPLFNRLVAFDTHDYSFHGLPDPINFPAGVPRRSLILYYYTKAERSGSDVSVKEPHSALWKKRNLLDKRGNKTRNFT